jgi:hypothetical protein
MVPHKSVSMFGRVAETLLYINRVQSYKISSNVIRGVTHNKKWVTEKSVTH